MSKQDDVSPAEDPSVAAYRHRPDAYATDAGDGPAVVFAHGTLMDRTMFDPQVEALRGDYRVVAYDLRARTDLYEGPYDLYDLADDCAALLNGLGVDSCVLGGMSMGGFMALRFAERYPERVDGLVLIDSVAEPHTPDEREQYTQMIEQTRAADVVPEPLTDIVKNLLFGATTVEENPDLVESWVDRWRTYPGEAIYHEVNSWLDRPDFTDRLADVDVPALLVHGEEDIALELERAEPMLDHLPDARLERIPKAGHSSNLERPDQVNAAVESFLRDVY